jgi:hypothetical protein
MSEPVAWQWLNTAHFRKNVPAGAEVEVWRPLYAHPAPSVEPVAWMTVEEDGTRHGLRGWSDGTHREVPLYMAPPDHREVMQMAVNSLVSLINAHFPVERELMTDEQCFAACYAVAALEKALGERE